MIIRSIVTSESSVVKYICIKILCYLLVVNDTFLSSKPIPNSCKFKINKSTNLLQRTFKHALHRLSGRCFDRGRHRRSLLTAA